MRLRPITHNIQKCLLPVAGKSMLHWWLDAVFNSETFEEVYVNVHYLADDVIHWIQRYSHFKNRKVNILDERKKLLGTAGTLKKLSPKKDFMVAYTDTYSEPILNNLKFYTDLWASKRNEMMAGLISFDPPNDGSASAIIFDSSGKVVDFKEKENAGDVSWMGTMFARPEFLVQISKEDKDLAREVFPRSVYQIGVIAHVDAYDIGRGVEHYERIKDGLIKKS